MFFSIANRMLPKNIIYIIQFFSNAKEFILQTYIHNFVDVWQHFVIMHIQWRSSMTEQGLLPKKLHRPLEKSALLWSTKVHMLVVGLSAISQINSQGQ